MSAASSQPPTPARPTQPTTQTAAAIVSPTTHGLSVGTPRAQRTAQSANPSGPSGLSPSSPVGVGSSSPSNGRPYSASASMLMREQQQQEAPQHHQPFVRQNSGGEFSVAMSSRHASIVNDVRPLPVSSGDGHPVTTSATMLQQINSASSQHQQQDSQQSLLFQQFQQFQQQQQQMVLPFSPNTCSPQKIKNWVTLNVGGQIFSTTRATLLQDKESLLYAMFRPDSQWDLDIDDKGHVLLDADGQYFGPILNFLRMNEVAIPPNVSNKGVLACAQYFHVQGVLDYFNRDKRQVVFSCGSGSNGELGTLDRLDVLTPSAVTIVPYNCRIVSVALGANYSCVLTNNGKVYTFGNGDWGQLGQGNPKNLTEKAEDRTPIVTIPTVVPALEKKFVTAISSGYAYAMVLTENHEVYFWGNNNHGQSGLGPTCFGLPYRKIETPVLVETLQGKQIIQLGCGSFFVLALSADGSMYSWGLVDCLGLGTMEQVYAMCKGSDELAESVSKDRRTVLLTPHKIPIQSDHKIVKINAGQWHSCAINSKGELFTWGVGFQGRLGHGNKDPYLVPTRVGGALEGHTVVDVACGSFHTAALTESGMVFCWGDNSNGQCGSSALPEAVMLPNCVNSLCVVAGGVARSISCGRQHTAVVMKGPHPWCNNYCCQLRHDGKPQAEHGQLYVFGESKGMGLGTTQRVCVAKLVTGMEVYNIGAVVSGLHHTFIVADVIPPVPYS